MSKTIAITKKELQIIKEAVNEKKGFITNTDSWFSNYSTLLKKLNKLHPHFEYVLDPIQYDEF